MNTKLCIEFNKNSLVNPLTKRKIKKDGPTYKKLEKECKNFNLKTYEKKSSEKQDPIYYCEELKKNPLVNPLTKNKIKKDGPTYKNLINFCSKLEKSDKDEMYTNLCKEWNKNKRYDPITKLKINNNDLYWNSYCGKKKELKNINYFFCDNTKWIIDDFLGKGGFGNVFSTHKESNPKKSYAVKIQSNKDNVAINEYNYFNSLYEPCNYIINYITGKVSEKFVYLIFDKLEEYKPTLETLPYFIKMFEHLSCLKISHGDVKFSNIMSQKNNIPVLIDFGLYFRITNLNKKCISGTLIYMSENAHKGIITYKNDLESLCYCLLELYKDLPWTDEIRKNNIENNIDIVKHEFKNDFIKTKGSSYPKMNSKLKLVMLKIFELKDRSLKIPNYNELYSILKS